MDGNNKLLVELYIDIGTRNFGQALVSVSNNSNPNDYNRFEIEYVNVYDFIEEGSKSDTEHILKNLNKYLDENKLIKECHRLNNNPSLYDLHISIENQEGLLVCKKNNFLAMAMIKMGIISGALYQYFNSKKFNVKFCHKREKLILCKKSKNHKTNINSTVKTILKNQNTRKSRRIEKWTKLNKKKAQHVNDSISGAMYNLSKRLSTINKYNNHCSIKKNNKRKSKMT